MSTQEKAVYKSGHKCRCDGGKKCECKYGNSTLDQIKLRSFWIAGWIDADMESK